MKHKNNMTKHELIGTFIFRIKDYRRSCDRIREKPQGCHNINNIFTVCVRIIGITNLHGCIDAKMHQRIPP